MKRRHVHGRLRGGGHVVSSGKVSLACNFYIFHGLWVAVLPLPLASLEHFDVLTQSTITGWDWDKVAHEREFVLATHIRIRRL